MRGQCGVTCGCAAKVAAGCRTGDQGSWFDDMSMVVEPCDRRRPTGRPPALWRPGLAWLFWAGLAVSCSQEHPGRGSGTEAAREELPDQEISDFVLRQTEGGRLEWVLRAASAQVFEATAEIRAFTMTIDFYDELGEVTSVLTADQGTLDRRTNAMQATGNVVVRSRDDRTLESETLVYSPDTRKIHTDDFVRLVDGRNELTGYGLVSDPDLAEGAFEIQREVEAKVLDQVDDPGRS